MINLFKKGQFENRIHEIDLFRGFLIILVIIDHLLWFINNYLFHAEQPFLIWFWTSDLRYILRQIVLIAFLFTCGISCHFSRNNSKRGLLLAALCIAITLVTHLLQLLPVFANRAVSVDFNILGVIALSILIFCLCQNLDSRTLMMIAAIMMVFYVFLLISQRNDTDMTYYPFKSILYVPFNPVVKAYVGDYLPLFPYCIALFIGVIFARQFYPNKESLFKKKGNWEKPICFLGRNTLFIYIAHEVVFTLIFMGLGALVK